MGMNPFITTQGFAKISMMTTLIGAVINIILDPIFIFGLHMGVRGAALATVLSQAVGAVWILRFLTGKQTILRLRKENLKLDPPIILPCLALGISTSSCCQRKASCPSASPRASPATAAIRRSAP